MMNTKSIIFLFLLMTISFFLITNKNVQQYYVSTPTTEGKDCHISSTYPDSIRRWCSLITQSANQQGIDPNLVAAVMTQESGGDPNAYSSSGAVGLLQVMPSDGLAASYLPYLSSRPNTQELLDPETNIQYGTDMLAGLISHYDGNIRDALRAYGPMDVGYNYADTVLSIYENSRGEN